ncbi:hypothetical protein BpHYR1_018772, partial [Brachionus plicatilis]
NFEIFVLTIFVHFKSVRQKLFIDFQTCFNEYINTYLCVSKCTRSFFLFDSIFIDLCWSLLPLPVVVDVVFILYLPYCTSRDD